MPPPPPPPSSATGSGAPTASDAQPASSYEGDTGVRAQQAIGEMEDARKLAFTKKEEQAKADLKAGEPGAPEQMAKSLGNIKGADGKPMFSPEEVKKIVEEKTAGAAGRPQNVKYTDPNDPTKKLYGTKVGGVVYDANQNPV